MRCAQLLDAPRPTELHTVVQRLTLLQIDRTSAVRAERDLVAWSRLGSAYGPPSSVGRWRQDRTCSSSTRWCGRGATLSLYLAGAAEWPSYDQQREWLRRRRFRRDIPRAAQGSGPLSSRDIPDTCVVPWARDAQARSQASLGATTALPILHEDRLVGKLDAVADRKASVLRVNAIHEDVKFTRTMTKAVRAEPEDLAPWLGLARSIRARTPAGRTSFPAEASTSSARNYPSIHTKNGFEVPETPGVQAAPRHDGQPRRRHGSTRRQRRGRPGGH